MTLDSDTTATTGDPRGRWHARGHLVLTGVVVVAYLLLPRGATAQAWLFVGLHVATIAAVVVGVRLHQPERTGIWRTLVAGHVLYGVGNVAWYLGPEVFGWALPFPSWVDAVYIAGYVVIGVGLWRLALARSRHRTGAAATEVAVVTLGVGAVAWLFLMAPYAADAQISLLTKLVALAYPGFAVMFVSVLAGLLILPGRRPRAFLLLALAVGSTLVADTAYALTTLEGTFEYGAAYMAPWLAYFGLFGAAALHPTMPRLSLPAEEEDEAESTWRPWALPIALAIPLVTLAYDQWSDERYVQIPVSLALAVAVLLVALRQTRLLREVARRAQAQANLVAGRDAAIEASQMKSDFLATMSHEIRTPMNAVIGMSGLLIDTDLDEDQQRYATGIRTAGEALMALINDVLDFSKIEAGKLEFEDADFDLEGTVEEVADLFSESAFAKDVLIYSYLHPDVSRAVRADAGRLRQVLVNLVNNAVKFTGDGRIIVRVRNEQREDEAAVLRFEVVDSGAGIPEHKQQHLFEVFTQADASSTRRHGGTGLGLAICRQLVHLMGGEIGVESVPDVGSTFWFTMPVRPLASERDDRWVRPLDGIRVLVVDDDEVNREIVERQARAWGMRPTSASSADDAMQLLIAATDDDPFPDRAPRPADARGRRARAVQPHQHRPTVR